MLIKCPVQPRSPPPMSQPSSAYPVLVAERNSGGGHRRSLPPDAQPAAARLCSSSSPRSDTAQAAARADLLVLPVLASGTRLIPLLLPLAAILPVSRLS